MRNIKNRLLEEIQILNHKLNILDPEFEIYEKHESRIKRIKFLLTTRRNLEDIKRNTFQPKVLLDEVEKKVKKELKRSRSPRHSFAVPTFEIAKYVNEEKRDIERVRQLSKQFGIIDKLIYLLHINNYAEKKQLKSNDVPLNRKSNIPLFETLKIMFANNRHLFMNSMSGEKVYGDHGYDANVFEYEDYMKIFLQVYEKYTVFWQKCKVITPEVCFEVASECIKTIIEMHSRASNYQFLNEQVKAKKEEYNELLKQQKFYQQVSNS